MKKIRYIEIEKFKTFGSKIHIELGHPAVLIGPNNSGKTTVIQALALWSRGIQAWYEKKSKPGKKEKRKRISAGINRLNIFEIPVSDTRNLWKNARVGEDNKQIAFSISVGVEVEENIYPCKLNFKRRDSETIYCAPDREIIDNEKLLKTAAGLQFNLLYPMSGIESEEVLLPEGRINVLLGQGQTAQVLRNLCYKIIEDQNTGQDENDDWNRITALIKKLFMVELKKPVFNAARGNLILNYSQSGVVNELDIALAGRGMQQMLLLLVYLYSHKGSILMIDEPDAHLEILRQKQVFEILKDVAEENLSQVIIATHSEVILDDAVDTNLTLLINGEGVNLATQQDIKYSLKNFGIEHYVKAKVSPRILYVEGSTDINNLKALAKRLNHPAYSIITSTLNYYYTQNTEPDDNLDNRLDRVCGSFGNYKQHFYTIKKFVQGLKGFGIFDSDTKDRMNEVSDDLAILYWNEYELENYFITPDILITYINSCYNTAGDLFSSPESETMQTIMNDILLKEYFDNNTKLLNEFNNTSKEMKRTLLRNYKISSFTEKTFYRLSGELKQPLIMNKGEFYKLIAFVSPDDIPREVTEKLDMLVEYLS